MLLAAAALVCLAMPTSRFQHQFPLFVGQRVVGGVLQRLGAGASPDLLQGPGMPSYSRLVTAGDYWSVYKQMVVASVVPGASILANFVLSFTQVRPMQGVR